MKTYEAFILERAFSPRGQAAREVMRKQNDINAARKAANRADDALAKAAPNVKKPAPATKASAMKDNLARAASRSGGGGGGGGSRLALPPAGGALAKRPSSAITKPADKGRALVKDKGGALAKRPQNLTKAKPNKLAHHPDSVKKADVKVAPGPKSRPSAARAPKAKKPGKRFAYTGRQLPNGDIAKKRAMGIAKMLKPSAKQDTTPKSVSFDDKVVLKPGPSSK